MLQTAQHVQRTVCFHPCYDVYAFCSVSALRRFESRRAAKDVFRLQQAWATDADALVMISPLRWGEHRVRIQDETKWSKYLWKLCVYIYICVYSFCVVSFYHFVSCRFSQVFRTVIPSSGSSTVSLEAICVIPCYLMQTYANSARSRRWNIPSTTARLDTKIQWTAKNSAIWKA